MTNNVKQWKNKERRQHVWRCYTCQYPNCLKCAASGKDTRPMYAIPHNALVDGQYHCLDCRYPPCKCCARRQRILVGKIALNNILATSVLSLSVWNVAHPALRILWSRTSIIVRIVFTQHANVVQKDRILTRSIGSKIILATSAQMERIVNGARFRGLKLSLIHIWRCRRRG